MKKEREILQWQATVSPVNTVSFLQMHFYLKGHKYLTTLFYFWKTSLKYLDKVNAEIAIIFWERQRKGKGKAEKGTDTREKKKNKEKKKGKTIHSSELLDK